MPAHRTRGKIHSLISRLRHRLTILLLAGLLPLPAQAIDSTVNTLIDIVINAADPSLAPVKPLIICAIDHSGNPVQCMESAAVKQAKQQAGGMVPFNLNDKRIRLVIDVVRDVDNQDWPKAVSDGGPVVVQTVACTILPLAGPGKGPACSVIGYVITHNAKLLKDAISALGGGPNWWKLIDLLGKDAVCMLVPDEVGVIKDIGCGALGEVLMAAREGLDAAYKGGKAIWYGAGEVTGLNDPKAMSQETYYNLYWQPWYHYATNLCLTNNCKGLGNLESDIWHPCKKYFADHDMTSSTAQSACDAMRDKKFNPQVKSFAEAMQVATDVYVENMRPWAKTWAVEDYGKNTLSERKDFVQQNAAIYLRSRFPFPEPHPGQCETIKQSPLYKNVMYQSLFDQLYSQCLNDANKQLPSPAAWNLMAGKAAQKFISIFNAEKNALDQQLPQLVSGGCYPPTAGWNASQGIKLVCDTYPGYQACLSTLSAGAEKQHCSIDQAKIDTGIVKQLLATLGSKRCQANGINVICSRPWKQQKCVKLRNQLAAGGPTKVQCKQGPVAALTAFAILEKQASDIVFILNGGVKKSTGMQTENGQGLSLYLPPARDSCKTTWDPLSIVCKDIDTLPKLAAYKKFDYCPHAKNDDGADSPCLVMTQAMMRNQMPLQVVTSPGVLLPGGGITHDNEAGPAGRLGGRQLTTGIKPVTPPVRMTPGGFDNTARPGIATGRVMTIARAQPVILDTQVHIESSCRSPQPALTLAVTLQNTGAPLAAGQGSIHAREIGATRLQSADINLPAIGAGQTALPLRIPVSTTQPYASLGGRHQLQLILEPQGNSFDVPRGRPQTLTVEFPANHCQPGRGLSLPARSSGSGGSSRAAPPEPRRQSP